MHATKAKQQGFTMIELVMTIVIIGILGVGISSFVGRTVQGMVDTAERQQLATIAWIISEKISRELRSALPNSIRTDAGCVEFIPTIAGTDYLSVPTFASATTANNFEVVPFSNYEASDVNTLKDRVAVYPNTITGLYNSTLPDPGVISGLIASQVGGATLNAQRLNLASNHQFLSDSPLNRLYIVQNPVMYCFSAGYLYRYSDYGYFTTFPSGASLDNQVVIGSRINTGTFTYTPGLLTRSAIVTMGYDIIGSDGATQAIDQEVQIRNVP